MHRGHQPADQTSGRLKRLTISEDGADDRNRTCDLLITNQLLYQLSYIGTWHELRLVSNDNSSKIQGFLVGTLLVLFFHERRIARQRILSEA
jgi:hypothetical protein